MKEIIWFLILVALAIGGFFWFAVKRAKNLQNNDSGKTPVAISRWIGLALLVVFGLLAFSAWPIGASPGDGDNSDTPKEQTLVLDEFKVCPKGVAEDPTYYVRGDDILSPWSVTPQLPYNDPDALIQALFGENGYACQDPAVAVAVSMVQPGLLPFTERDDANEVSDWVKLFATNGEAWLSYVSQAATRFDGIQWDPQWLPEDGDATFLVADANEGEPYPALKQREEGLPRSWGAYRFKENYGDSPLLKDLALIADFGWLALPEGQFSRTPVLELDKPLFPEEPPPPPTTAPEQADKGKDGKDNSGGGSGKNRDRGGGNNADQHNGDDQGCTGTCGDGGQDQGNGTGNGDGGCGSGDCPGGGGDKPGDGCDGCGPSTTKPPSTTAPPTTRPPSTTAPPTTRPPSTTTTTIRPSTTTTTIRPSTTTTQAPPTTKAPDPGCAGMPGC